MRRLLSCWPSLLGAALLAGCGSDPTFDIEVVARDNCNGLDIIEPNHKVVLTVRGPDLEKPITVEANGSDGTIEVPEIPAGKDRVVTVEVWNTAGGRRQDLQAHGESLPFDVNENGTPKVQVILYRTNFFSDAVGKDKNCARMIEARAGHVGVALSKHEVLLAGGYTEVREGKPKGMLASAEVFDLRTGTFKSVAAMPSARAFARAVRLKDGRVLVIGGVREDGDGLALVGDAAIFDGRSWSRAEMLVARRDFTATLVEETGEVLVVGGVDADGKIVSTVEAFDPKNDAFREVQLEGGVGAVTRAYHAAALQRGEVKLVGGVDAEGKVRADGAIVRWDSSRGEYAVQEIPGLLEEPVLRPAVLSMGSAVSPRLVIGGGHTAYIVLDKDRPGEGSPGSDTRLVQVDPPANAPDIELTAPVGDSCAVRFDNNRGLFFGGSRSGVGALPPTLANFVRFSSPTAPPTVTEAGDPGDRKFGVQHTTCAPIGEKGALIAGGLGQDGRVTGAALVYLVRQDSQG
ncbi:MAG TPA: kelch repeat-containing protein [Fredinandcohnia sp.]|nr:kelch repeat-containing protein [Fredinandcohnia sp.]